MKTINILCIALSIIAGFVMWKYSELFIVEGTTVIYSMINNDGKRGDQPYTMKVPNLTHQQQILLNFAYETAKADGYLHPVFLQGILMQESKGCSMKNFRVAGLTNKPNDRYFGCGQLKMDAAKSVLRQYPEMWKYLESRTDEELQARLILDDKFNIRIASKYALMMGINDDSDKAITAYNVGPGGVRNVSDVSTFEYTSKVNGYSAKLNNHKKSIQAKLVNIELKGQQRILLAREP